jgi:PPM family protein phosphatase
LDSISITDIGLKRQINQDFVYCTEKPVGKLPNLFIVADGMGGHKAGDFASKFSVEVFIKKIKESQRDLPIEIIREALELTNELLHVKAHENSDLNGMGTTFVAATIYDKHLYVANIGDSRLYIINNHIKQITKDHSFVEEMVKKGKIDPSDARFHPNKNIITRALGVYDEVTPDFFELNLEKGDIVLMCSDGLSNMLEDKEIMEIVNNYQDKLGMASKELVDKANQRGGKDNISVIIVKL